MTNPIVDPKANTNGAPPAGTDIKTPVSTLLGSTTPPVKAGEEKILTPDEKAAADAAVAKAKADADAGKTPEAIKAEADAAAAQAEADKKAKEGAPEKYEPFKSPENVKLDEVASTEASAVFKELNLSQDKAQKIMDLGTKHFEKVAAQMQEASAKALNDAGEAWRKEIETDKELGGANFKASNEAALLFRDKFTSPEERKSLSALFDSAWGNHPVLWKLFVRAGQAMREDKIVDGGTSNQEVSVGDAMYPSMRQKK